MTVIEIYDKKLAAAEDKIASKGVSRTAILLGATNQEEEKQVSAELDEAAKVVQKVIELENQRLKIN